MNAATLDVLKSEVKELGLEEVKTRLQAEFDFHGNWSTWEAKQAIVVAFVADYMAAKLRKFGFVFSAKSGKYFLFLGE